MVPLTQGSQPVSHETFQGVLSRPPFYLIHILIYLKMGSRGYEKFGFFVTSTVFEKWELFFKGGGLASMPFAWPKKVLKLFILKHNYMFFSKFKIIKLSNYVVPFYSAYLLIKMRLLLLFLKPFVFCHSLAQKQDIIICRI